jgi:ubiquinone/menaquinone biosynthesis C-methylase UbiE
MPSTFNARNADAYEHFMGRWSRVLAGEFIAFAGVADGERVLDVGCGTGSLTFALARSAKVARIAGIDYAEIFLEAARRANADERITFERGDACALPYADASFDRALALLVLQFVPDAARAAAEMRRVVRPGGVVAAAVWDGFGGMPHHRMVWDTAAAIDPATAAARHEAFFRPMAAPGQMAAAWTRLGLRDVTQTSLTIRKDYADFNDFWWPIAAGETGLGKFVAGLAPDARGRLERAVRAAWEAGEADGPRSFAATAWACRGVVP